MLRFIKKAMLLFVLSFCFMNILCEDLNDDVILICDEMTIVNQEIYDNLTSVDFTFINAEIIDDCLNIEIGASGCDGNSWEFVLVDSGAIAESLPEQRYLKLQLINDELCLAFFEKIISFDLTPVQVNRSHEIILNIEGLESSLNYKY